MKLELGNKAYISIKTCAQGISLFSVEGSGSDDDCTILILTRKQVIELIAMLVSNIHPLPTQQELDEELVRLVFNNLPPGGVIVGKLGVLTEDDFMEDHGDNL